MSLGILMRVEGDPLLMIRKGPDGSWAAKLRLDVVDLAVGSHRVFGRAFGPVESREELDVALREWAGTQAEQDREGWLEVIVEGLAKHGPAKLIVPGGEPA